MLMNKNSGPASGEAKLQYGPNGFRVLRAGQPIDAATAGRVLQYRLDTKHVLDARYWRAILDFADLHLR